MKNAVLVACAIVIVSSSFLQISNSFEKTFGFATNESSEYPEEFYISGVPYKYQNGLYWCGPASLAMVLSYWGDYVSQENIADSVINPDNLTKCENLAKYAKSLGFNASYGTITIEELKENISSGYPVIVLQRYSLDSTENHFRVVVGYDEGNLITHNPIYLYNYPDYVPDYSDYPTRDYYIPYDNFVEVWKLENYENEFVIVYPPAPPPMRDNTLPTILIISPSAGQILGNCEFEVSWEGEDQESGIERYEVKMDNLDWDPTTNTSKQFYASDGEHTIYIRAIDRAGNLTEGNVRFTVNTGEIADTDWIIYVPPIVVILILLLKLIQLLRRKKVKTRPIFRARKSGKEKAGIKSRSSER